MLAPQFTVLVDRNFTKSNMLSMSKVDGESLARLEVGREERIESSADFVHKPKIAVKELAFVH